MGTKHIVGNLEVEGKVSAPNLVTTDGGTITGPLWATDGTTEYGFTVVDGPLGVRVHGAADEAGSQPPTIYGYGAIEYHKQDGTDTYLKLPNKNGSYSGTLALTDDIPTEKINLLERALFPAGTKYTADITDEYNGRTTAHGENVLDGTLAVVKTVEGDTVACENLFNIEQNLDLMQGCLWEEDTQTFVMPPLGYAFSWSARKLPYPIPVGTKVSVTLFYESGYVDNGSSIAIGLYHNETGAKAWACLPSTPILTDLKGKTYSKTQVLETSATHIWIFCNSVTNVTTEVRVRVVINIGDAPKMFTPFYTGLKNASFQGLVSTQRNYFDITQMPTTYKWIIDGNDITVVNEYYVNTGKTIRQLFPNIVAGRKYTAISTAICNQEVTDATGSIRVLYTGADGTSKIAYFTPNGCPGVEKQFATTIPEEALDSNVLFYGKAGNAITTWKNFRLVELEGETEVTDDLTLPNAIDLGYGTMVDFENQQIVENYGSYTFTGEETDWVIGATPDSNGDYRNGLYSGFPPMKMGTQQFGFCDRFPIKTNEGWGDLSPYTIRLGQGNKAIYLITPTQPTLEELQTLTKGMTIRYPLATPIVTPFTDAQKFVGKTYTAYNHGMEMVTGNTNEDFTKPTITQNYVLVEEV